jgi:hypothetical protein
MGARGEIHRKKCFRKKSQTNETVVKKFDVIGGRD